MIEIPRWLELQQEIDYLYFALGEIKGRMPGCRLDSLIDEVTGFDKHQKKQILEICTRMKELKTEWIKETGEEASLETETQIIELCKL
jgi:tRNA nucleotidyltransferase/poly(A) polymerase